MNTGPSEYKPLSGRASKVALAIMLVTAASGYFMGIRQAGAGGTDESSRSLEAATDPREAAGPTAAPAAVEYRRMGEAELKPNARWRSSLPLLVKKTSSAYESSQGKVASDAERRDAVEYRARRRAFDGAPPVIPHSVDAVSTAACGICHDNGYVVRDVVAPRMSHARLGSCTQCHVASEAASDAGSDIWETSGEGGLGFPGGSAAASFGGGSRGKGMSEDFAVNEFQGLVTSGNGSRAWPGAPPTIPHSSWMRQNCASCHGLFGHPGLRTSHPERMLCAQCHVPGAGLDSMTVETVMNDGSPGNEWP